MSLLLFGIYNAIEQTPDWLSFTTQIIMTGRQRNFDILRSNNFKIGLNILPNKLYSIRNSVSLDYLDLPYHQYKTKKKLLFKPFGM